MCAFSCPVGYFLLAYGQRIGYTIAVDLFYIVFDAIVSSSAHDGGEETMRKRGAYVWHSSAV